MEQAKSLGAERVLLVMPPEGAPTKRDEITLSELVRVLWREKWLVVAITIVGAAASVAYALLATQWFAAEVVLAPVQRGTGGIAEGLNLGGLSGLANLTGINLGDNDSAEPIAVLRSRGFTAAFIEEQQLMPLLLAEQWDASAKRWQGDDSATWPDIRDAVRYFDENVRTVEEDTVTGLVTLTVEWTDPEKAAEWANLLVDRLNARMRERALEEAERNIGYLRQELTSANIVALQQSVGRLLENEMQKMMMARGSAEYSFRFIDRAVPPKWRSRPNRPQVAILGTTAAGMLAVLIAFVRHTRRRRVV